MTTRVEYNDDCPSCGEPAKEHTLEQLGQCNITVSVGPTEWGDGEASDLNVGQDA